MRPYDDGIDRYMDGSAGHPSPRTEDRPLPEESYPAESFTECVQPVLGYLRSCMCFSGPSSAKTSMFFSILLLISITLNLIGDPFDPTAKKAVFIDKRVVEAQSILGEEWSTHQAVRAEIEQQRKEWVEEQREMQKRLREIQVRDRERMKLEKERKAWEKEQAKRQKLKKKFEAKMKQSNKKWGEEKNKNEKSRNDL